MKCVFILSLLCYVRYATSQYTQIVGQRQPKSPCESPNKNSLIEHFFNTVFTEFFSSPPVCVCVQMCKGQSSYCYPNGCLKATKPVEKEDVRKVSTKPPPQIQKNKNKFMLVKDMKNDFMAEFLERYYPDETKTDSNTKAMNPPQDLRPDPFKDKYTMIGKFKRVPKIELNYNLKEKVKSPKSELAKIEGIDLTNTRWPLNRNFGGNRQKKFPKVEKPIAQPNYFTTMLKDHEVNVEYPPRYFKRDLTKAIESDDVNIKAFYVLEDWFNATENKNVSLETLIDTLIRSSFGINEDEKTNKSTAKRDETDIPKKTDIDKVISVNSTGLDNQTTSVISMNFTNETVDKNKYVDETLNANKTTNLNEMITYLAKEIEKQNNTSMEIAKTVVNDFDEAKLTNNIRIVSIESNPTSAYVENVDKTVNITPTTHSYKDPESTTVQETVTKKNRQRVIRKLAFSKIN